MLGMWHLSGEGPNCSYSEASDWLHKSAAQGDATAQFALAAMYKEGKGVDVSTELSYFWMRKAAAQGEPAAVKAMTLVPCETAESLQRDWDDALAYLKEHGHGSDRLKKALAVDRALVQEQRYEQHLSSCRNCGEDYRAKVLEHLNLVKAMLMVMKRAVSTPPTQPRSYPRRRYMW